MKKKSFSGDGGFSLVELAIALIIIGLLVGAILKGKELIESARLTSILTQVKEYQLAVTSFHLKYGALPGDFNQAKELIDPTLVNGDGDGLIREEAESHHFWTHLTKGDFLSTEPAPASRIGGCFTVIFEDGKHWFLLSEKNKAGLLTPPQASSLMRKMGISDVSTGSVYVKNGVDRAGDHTCLNADGSFNLTHKERACIVYFQFPI